MTRNVSIFLTVALASIVVAGLLMLRSTQFSESNGAREVTTGGEEQHRSPQQARLQAPSLAVEPRSPQRMNAASDPAVAGQRYCVFRLAGDKPAAGLRLYRAGDKSILGPCVIKAGPALWDYQLGSDGELDDNKASALGDHVALRLSSDAVEVIPFDPSSTRTYNVTAVIEQRFTLPAGLDASMDFVEIAVEGQDLSRFVGAVDYRNPSVLDEVGFADKYIIKVKPSEPRVMAVYARRRLDRTNPTATVQIPRGMYTLVPIGCSPGWSCGRTALEVNGTTFELSLTKVPVTFITLRRDDSGNVQVPRRVTLSMHTAAHDGMAETSGEVELQYSIDGQRMTVGERYRLNNSDAPFTTYGLILHWADGTTTATRLSTWEDLLQPIDLSGT